MNLDFSLPYQQGHCFQCQNERYFEKHFFASDKHPLQKTNVMAKLYCKQNQLVPYNLFLFRCDKHMEIIVQPNMQFHKWNKCFPMSSQMETYSKMWSIFFQNQLLSCSSSSLCDAIMSGNLHFFFPWELFPTLWKCLPEWCPVNIFNNILSIHALSKGISFVWITRILWIMLWRYFSYSWRELGDVSSLFLW